MPDPVVWFNPSCSKCRTAEFVLDAGSAEAWDAVNRRRARELPGLRRLMERPSPFAE